MSVPEATTLVETAGEIMQAEIDAGIEHTEAVLEVAAQQIDNAQRTAAEIAEAAMQTEIGRRVAGLEQRGMEWQAERDGLRQELNSQAAEISRLREQLAATATLTVATALTPAPQSSSIPAISPNPETLAEATTTVTEIVPEALHESVEGLAAPEPLPAPPAKRHRFL